ncbi:chaperonin-like RbcX protein 2, chloroplastic isoform X2 [Gastrolobium bilobum]|uniref:chaperonin-like RbcX protein 2, chloroplastic isoform X2 n=1 Tax=Gastrolobium bilobum TaxID=150636 RepID=UPI002AB20700|nr:chaperonin-like RbcX protein 2, chloroplastic isoform X2 [Gastrolobium bilobum]
MVGALSVVGSSVLDSHTGPCLCVDALPTTSNLMGKKHLLRRGTMELNSSFTDPGRGWRLCVSRSCKKQRRDRRFTIVNELGGQYDDNFEDVKTQMLNYFTYKAVRTVLQQLYEMNPPKYTWFYNFVASNKPADGKRFIRSLGKEHQELAERVMVTRLHLYGKWVKKCNHAEIYQEISDENLELMRERLMETVIWPSDDTNIETIG